MDYPCLDSADTTLPLCVDLDGTLLRTDTLYETLLLLLKAKPWCVFLLPLWIVRGKAYLKQRIAEQVELNPATLPYHTDFLAFLNAAKQRGWRLILATAANRRIADAVAAHLGIFDAVLASDASHNLKSAHKAQALQNQFGDFIYAGNDSADLAVWQQANAAIVVNATPALTAQARQVTRLMAEFPPPKQATLKTWLQALRPHQWVKNSLIFLPLLAGHQFTNLGLLMNTGLAFLVFSLIASSAYLLNDLLDLEADRKHRSKRYRPFASGALSLRSGLLVAPLLVLLSLGLSLILLPVAFSGVLLLYYVLTLGYSFYFKRVEVMDVLCLAILYTMRVVAGSVVGGLALSNWFVAFVVFLFLCLAFIKRHSELYYLRQSNKHQASGRGYVADDLEILASMGIASGYLAVLVLTQYINSPEVRVLYTQPDLLWLVSLLLLYWISRVWLIAHRGHMHDDPVVFALKDKASYVVVALIALVVAIAL